MACSDPSLASVLKSSLEVVSAALRIYGHINVFCAFNGGKDAVIILHLYRAALAKHCLDRGLDMIRPRVLFFKHQREFSEVTDFVAQMQAHFELEVQTYSSGFVNGLMQCGRERRYCSGVLHEGAEPSTSDALG